MMNAQLKIILPKYVKETKDNKFLCEIDTKNDFDVPVIIAQACPQYKEDVEDELYCEDLLSCYNCRYRRWERGGFSCYKGFPIK